MNFPKGSSVHLPKTLLNGSPFHSPAELLIAFPPRKRRNSISKIRLDRGRDVFATNEMMFFFFFCNSFKWLMKENKSGLPWKFKICVPKHSILPPMSHTGPWGPSDYHQSTKIKIHFYRNAWAWYQPFRARQSGVRNHGNGKSRSTWTDMKIFRHWKTVKHFFGNTVD